MRETHTHHHTYGDDLPNHVSFTHSHPHPISGADPLAAKSHTHLDGVAHAHPHLAESHRLAKSHREPKP